MHLSMNRTPCLQGRATQEDEALDAFCSCKVDKLLHVVRCVQDLGKRQSSTKVHCTSKRVGTTMAGELKGKSSLTGGETR
jgi:hypothetical protein